MYHSEAFVSNSLSFWSVVYMLPKTWFAQDNRSHSNCANLSREAGVFGTLLLESASSAVPCQQASVSELGKVVHVFHTLLLEAVTVDLEERRVIEEHVDRLDSEHSRHSAPWSQERKEHAKRLIFDRFLPYPLTQNYYLRKIILE